MFVLKLSGIQILLINSLTLKKKIHGYINDRKDIILGFVNDTRDIIGKMFIAFLSV